MTLLNFQPVDPAELQALPRYLLSEVSDFTGLPKGFVGRIRVHRDSGCWLWVGNLAVNPRYQWQKYGQWTVNAKMVRGIFQGRKHTYCAHKFAYERQIGPVPQGFELDHLCEVKLCVNPRHLELVTRSENMLRYFRRKAARRG